MLLAQSLLGLKEPVLVRHLQDLKSHIPTLLPLLQTHAKGMVACSCQASSWVAVHPHSGRSAVPGLWVGRGARRKQEMSEGGLGLAWLGDWK